MVDEERWKEIRRLCWEERVSISEVARRFAVDRKTVRHCLRQETWRPYQRAPKAETLLSAHGEFLRERAPQVAYSARILFQELKGSRGYTGSYETVKRFVAPLATNYANGPLTPTSIAWLSNCATKRER